VAELVEWISSELRFAELAPSWDRLAEGQTTPFARHAWLAAWWRAFGAGSKLRVCVLWRDERIAGAFPLHRRGARLEAMANVHTPVFEPLAEDRAALDRVLDAVLEARVAELEVSALPASSAAFTGLEARARAGQELLLSEPVHTSPLVDLRGEFATFRAESKPRWGAPLERFGRKLERDHSARFSLVEPPVDLDAELQRGFEVEASGWKGTQGTAILSSPQTAAFYREIAHSFAAIDGLRLSGIYCGDRLVAFDLTLLHARRLWLLKTGYHEEFRRLAPGLVMRLKIIERCYELGLEGHELLGDDSEWKRKFANGAREHRVVRLYGRRPDGVARYVYRRAIRPRLARAYRRSRLTAEARR